jgi:hypothetical protein
MWIWLVGTNGDGLLGKFEKFVAEMTEWREAVNKQLQSAWTQDDHEQYIKSEAECNDQLKNRRKVSTREWLLLTLTFVGPIVAVLIAHFLK